MKENNEFKNFVAAKARMLPVILLLDVSGSMSYDNKIDELNTSVKEMIQSFTDEQILQAEICVSIITFGSDVKLHTDLMPARNISFADLTAYGATCMGKAFDLAGSMIEDKTKVPKNAYRPVVVLVSDGEPYDPEDPNNREFEKQLERFTKEGRSSKCDRWSLAIGEDADADMMKRFLDNPEKSVCYVDDAGDIHKFFRFISSCTIQRSQSRNPNVVPEDLFNEDILNMNFEDFG